MKHLFFIIFIIASPFFLFYGDKERFFVGTYTGKGENDSKGIYSCEFDVETGTLSPPKLVAECDNPSFIIVHPDKMQLYAVGESAERGKLYSFDYRESTGELNKIDQITIPGQGPCHLALARSENQLFDSIIVANYSSGNVVTYPVFESGKFSQLVSNFRLKGSGRNAVRQESPHPHGVYVNPADKNTIAVTDLGTDHIDFYTIDAKTARMEKRPFDTFLLMPSGSGPRHLAFSKSGRFAYVNGELNSTIGVFQVRGQNPHLIQEAETLPQDVDKTGNETGEIVLAPSGRFLYVSNRGHDSISMFGVIPDEDRDLSADTGRLHGKAAGDRKMFPLATVPCGGKHPRFFTIDKTGDFLIVCNRDSNNIVVFRIEPETGKLSQTGNTVKVPKPVCIAIAP